MNDESAAPSQHRESSKDVSVTARGVKAIRTTDDGKSTPETVPVTVALWVFVIGTAPFFAISNILLWLDPSLMVATLIFWVTGVPLAVAVPLAILGSAYQTLGGQDR